MSEEPVLPEQPTRNEETRRAFNRQAARQIYLPLVLFFLALAGAGLGLGLSGTGSFSLWADISIMLLSIPMLILGLVLLVLSAALVYGASWLLKAVPGPAWQVQQFFSNAAERIHEMVDNLSGVIIRINALPAVFTRRRKDTAVQDTGGEKSE